MYGNETWRKIMRRQNYFNNRKIRRQAKKVICIATLAATMLTSIPFVSYTDAYAKGQTTLEEMKVIIITLASNNYQSFIHFS